MGLPRAGSLRAAAVVLVCLCGCYAAGFLAVALWPRAGAADLAVVLGNQVMDDGQPSPRLAARLDAAVRAYRDGLVPLVLVSGGTGPNGRDEASAMRDHLVRAGVPDRAVLLDPAGVDTQATARNTVALMRTMGLRRVLVVTQYFHVPRCLLALHRAGAEAVGATYPAWVEARDPYSLVRELVALPVYALSR